MKESMRSKLVQLGRRLEEIDAMLSAPDAANDMNRFRDLSRERSELEPVVAKMKQYETAHQSYREAVRRDPDNRKYRQGALDAALAMKKNRPLSEKILDWARGKR